MLSALATKVLFWAFVRVIFSTGKIVSFNNKFNFHGLSSKLLQLLDFSDWQGYIVRFGQCSVFLIPINKRQPLEISVVASRCTVVNSAPIVKISWNQEKYTLPWPW
jgi:hypothetical protein